MVVAIAKAGRPHAVAEINFQTDRETALRDEFYDACANLTYREIAGLSRALGLTLHTVYQWKYKMVFPNWYTALAVTDWVRHGKPIRLEAPWQSAADML